MILNGEMAEWFKALAWKAWLADSGCRSPELQIMLVACPRFEPADSAAVDEPVTEFVWRGEVAFA